MLDGAPLLTRAVKTALALDDVRVVVSTNDEEIAAAAARAGAEVRMRAEGLAQPNTTLDEVIAELVRTSEAAGERHAYVLTVQGTSPFVSTETLAAVISQLGDGTTVDTAMTVTDDRHLTWTIDDQGRAVPRYAARVNRQELPPNFRETGSAIACTWSQALSGTRIGERVALVEVSQDEALDIDSSTDFLYAHAIAARRRIVFHVRGTHEVGSGHVRRAMTILDHLAGHDIAIVCGSDDELVQQTFDAAKYEVHQADAAGRAAAIAAFDPDLIVNDILDTERSFMESVLATTSATIVNFEDLGTGATLAHYLINCLYPPSTRHPNAYTGAQYFMLREEFTGLRTTQVREHVRKVLITFGGTDPGGLTVRLARLLAERLAPGEVNVDLVTTPQSATSPRDLPEHPSLTYVGPTPNISGYMQAADLAITSGGRTVFELAALGVPTIVICQNERETTHEFFEGNPGYINLGLHDEATDDAIWAAFEMVRHSHELRRRMHRASSSIDWQDGSLRVVELLRTAMKGPIRR